MIVSIRAQHEAARRFSTLSISVIGLGKKAKQKTLARLRLATKPRPVVAPGGKRTFVRTALARPPVAALWKPWRDHRSRLCESDVANTCDVNIYD